MERVDCHTHTFYSDGSSTLEHNVAAAAMRGMTTIACTDHLAHPAFMDCSIDESRIEDLARDIARCREMHPGLDIVFGFEADWYEGCERDIAALRKNATFLLGSIHYLGEYAIDWLQDMRIWNEIGPDEVWRLYVDDWCRACFCPIGFDSMAHPDLVRLFEKSGYAPSIALEPLWDSMAEAAREADMRIEVSTAGLRKELGDFYPAFGLLERFRAAGDAITVG
ncbi:MAG: PHP domain-containing protein, partial [Slackia sp.]|nr:PHP domain-containing protein [Slackia sp.]